jgi:hypothetical protein
MSFRPERRPVLLFVPLPRDGRHEAEESLWVFNLSAAPFVFKSAGFRNRETRRQWQAIRRLSKYRW